MRLGTCSLGEVQGRDEILLGDFMAAALDT